MFKARALPILLSLCLTLSPFALANSGFISSCNNIQMLKDVNNDYGLEATCTKQDGSTKFALIDLDTCLANSNGNLVHAAK